MQYPANDLFTKAPIAIGVYRGDSCIIELANERMLEYWGRQASEVLGKPLFDALPEAREQGLEEIVQKVFRTGQGFVSLETQVTLLRHGKRQTAWYTLIFEPISEDDGITTGVMGLAHDITDRVRARHILEESERQFREVFMRSPVAKAVLRGQDMIIEMVNDAMVRKIWRRSPGEVMKRKLLEVFPELEGQPFLRLLRSVLDNGAIYREEEAITYIDASDGRRKYWLDFEYAPLFEHDGTVSGIMATVNDVTEKVEARQKIEEARERLQLAVEGTRLAIWDLNLQTRSIIHSPRLAEIFGHPSSRILTHEDLRAQMHPEDRVNIIEKRFAHALHSGSYGYEARVFWPDHTLHWIRTRGKVIYDEQELPLRLLGTLQDITESKNAEEELERKVAERTRELKLANDELTEKTRELNKVNEELIRTNQELSSFAYVSSHDLQEPLRKIQTFASLLVATERDNLSEKGKEYFLRMEKAAMRMRQLIQDLLAYSRTNNREKVFEELSMEALLQEIREEIKERIREKNATLRSAPLPVLRGIPFQLRQLFTNIISNSLKFGKPDLPVSITIEYEKREGGSIGHKDADPAWSYHLFSITDNGIGFEPEYNERIFEVFQRLHGNAQYTGTGIGLAICKKILENHRGFITARGTPGMGARFDIYLPALVADSDVTEPDATGG